MQQMNILCASGSLCSRVTVWLRLFHFWAGSEIQNNPEQITGAGSFPVTTCTSSAYLSFGINSEEVYWKKYSTLKILVHLRCVILFFCTTPPVLHSELGIFFFFFCQAAGQEQHLVQQLGASLLFWCRQLPVVKMVQWESALKSQGR